MCYIGTMKQDEYEDTALEAMQDEDRLFLTSLADEQADRDEEKGE